MDLNKYDLFTKINLDTDITYTRNKVKIEVESDKKQLLFLPIAYNDGYNAKVNGNKVEVVKVFDNFIGVMVDEGENNITLSFIPKGFIVTLLISMITLIITIIILKTNLYYKILDIKWLHNIAYYGYMALYLLLVFIVYIMMTICFIISYFISF